MNIRINNILSPTINSVTSKIPVSLFKYQKIEYQPIQQDALDFFDNKLIMSNIMDILQDYSFCIMDISLNEVTVHSLSHSRLLLDKPYLKLESKVLKQTSAIFQLIHPVNQGKEVVEQFFCLDSKIISQLFLNRTFCRYFNCAVEKQVTLIDEFLIEGPSLDSSSSKQHGENQLLSMKRNQGCRSFEPFELLENSGGDKDSELNSPDICLKLFKESLLKKVLEKDLSSEEDDLEEKMRKANSCNYRKKTSDFNRLTPVNMKRNHSKVSLPRLEEKLKPLPTHNPEEFELFSDLKSVLVNFNLILDPNEQEMSRSVLRNRCPSAFTAGKNRNSLRSRRCSHFLWPEHCNTYD